MEKECAAEKREFLTASQLTEKEHNSLRLFFGKEVFVAEVPSLLLETQKRATEDLGFSSLTPIYFPQVEFNQFREFPGWKVKPQPAYWHFIEKGRIDSNAAKLNGCWALFDCSVRPNMSPEGQMPEGDQYLRLLLTYLRRKGRIPYFYDSEDYEGTRFGVSPQEQDLIVLRYLIENLYLSFQTRNDLVNVRRPTMMEFNFVGNLRYPHLGKANTGEWLNDRLEYHSHLIGGRSCLEYLDYEEDYKRKYDLAFRPLLIFSSKISKI